MGWYVGSYDGDDGCDDDDGEECEVLYDACGEEKYVVALSGCCGCAGCAGV